MVSARKIACRQSRRSISSNGGTRKKVDELLACTNQESFHPRKNNSQGEADEQYLIAPSILSADFARLGEDTQKPWQLALMSCILTSWITTSSQSDDWANGAEILA